MYELTEILPSGKNGERLLLRISIGENENVSFVISASSYAKLKLHKGEISIETFRKLQKMCDYEQALMKAMNILGYGINSEKALVRKLKTKGISEKNAYMAVEYLKNHGYLDENKDALRICDSLICKKYGKKKIISSLYAKGYSQKAIENANDYLSNIDFTDLCAQTIRAKFKKMPADPLEMKKILAKLVYLGYNVGEAKTALKTVMCEE